MEATPEEPAAAIIASSFQGVLVVTGAGSQAVAWLLAAPGASAFLLEALIPYSQAALGNFLGHQPEQFVSAETAAAIARRAYARAQTLAGGRQPLVGLGCTATIATNRPKRGPHRAYLAAWTGERIFRARLELEKGRRTRPEEEAVVSQVLLGMLARACKVRPGVEVELLSGDRFEITEQEPGELPDEA